MISKRNQSERLILGEIQLLLSEKRTYFSLLRTGIAIFTFPLTIIAFLGATNEYHGLYNNVFLGSSLTAALVFISLVGLVLFFLAEARIKRINRLLREEKSVNKRVSEILI